MQTDNNVSGEVGEKYYMESSIDDARWLLGAVLAVGFVVLATGVAAAMYSV